MCFALRLVELEFLSDHIYTQPARQKIKIYIIHEFAATARQLASVAQFS